MRLWNLLLFGNILEAQSNFEIAGAFSKCDQASWIKKQTLTGVDAMENRKLLIQN